MSNNDSSPQLQSESLRERVSHVSAELGEQVIVENAEERSSDVVITLASSVYPDGEPIRIRVSNGAQQSGDFILSDEGRTLSYAQATALSLNKPESLDSYIGLWKQPPIQRDGVVLSMISDSEPASLMNALNFFTAACHSLAAIGKVTAEIDEWLEAKERAEREERKSKAFRLKTRDEVVAFQEHLEAYVAGRTGSRFNQLSLVDAYDYLRNRSDRERIMAAVLDLVIGYSGLLFDYLGAERMARHFFGKGRIESGSILDSDVMFAARMDIHCFDTSFVLRYRALWDKIMGIYILLLMPASYENFVSGNSRKGKFKSLIDKQHSQLAGLAQSFVKLITEFDQQFRTPEAHGPGVLRKWTLIIEPLDESPQNELGLYWARMRTVLGFLGDVFRGPEKTILRELSEIWARLERKEMPDDLRSLMRSVLSVLEQITPTYIDSNHGALVRLQIHTSTLCSGIYAGWLHQKLDRGREMEEEHVRELQSAIAELPDPQPQLLQLIHELASYGADRGS